MTAAIDTSATTYTRPRGLRHGEWARLQLLLDVGAVKERIVDGRIVYERNRNIVGLRLVPAESNTTTR